MFRPCIDLHEGKVKQIVGGTLSEAPERLRTNFISDRPAAWFAEMYRQDELTGGHLIMLDRKSDAEALAALAAYPGGLQVGGGINAQNARAWLNAGASMVIVTSWVFREGRLDMDRLKDMIAAAGRGRLVLDLSCRRRDGEYFVVTDRWQKFTEMSISLDTLRSLAKYCAEFLVHAVDVEGGCGGIDRELVRKLGEWSPIPTTYAGGVASLSDLDETHRLGKGRVDLTIGSALDIFGGRGVRYADALAFNRRLSGRPEGDERPRLGGG